jgi:hypothetical protein
MSKSPFVTLIFRGARFEGAVMPLETLIELAAYRDLVLTTAKALFLAKNPGRERVPKGFEAGLRLVLDQNIQDGSAVPVVSRVVEQSLELFPEPPAPDVFDEARNLLERAIDAVANGRQPPPELSQEALVRFKSFGRTLLGEESIVVAQPGTRQGAIYTRGVQRRLVLCAKQSYEDEVDLVGEVRAADRDTEGFVLRTTDARKFHVYTPPLFFSTALRSLTDSIQVRVRGVGLFNAEGTLQRVLLATDVSLTEEDDDSAPLTGCLTPVDAQVESLKLLEAGWYDETSLAYDPVALDWVRRLLEGLLGAFKLPTPYIYPTPEGLVRLEWSVPEWEVIVNLDLAEKAAAVIAARLDDTNEPEELQVAFQDPGAESILGRFLGDHLHPH